jgi:hypothetical protein
MAGCTHALARAACMQRAAGCVAAAAEPVRVVSSALPRRSHSTTQSVRRCCRGRPRTSDDPALPAQHMRMAHSEYHDELQKEAILGRSPDRIRFARSPW